MRNELNALVSAGHKNAIAGRARRGPPSRGRGTRQRHEAEGRGRGTRTHRRAARTPRHLGQPIALLEAEDVEVRPFASVTWTSPTPRRRLHLHRGMALRSPTLLAHDRYDRI